MWEKIIQRLPLSPDTLGGGALEQESAEPSAPSAGDSGAEGQPSDTSNALPAETSEEQRPGKFFDQTTDRFKKDPEMVKRFSGYQKIDDVLEKLMELESKTEGAIRIPAEDAADEEKKAFLKAIGVPEDPNEYEFPEGVDDESKKYIIEGMKDLNLNKFQFKGILNWLNETSQAGYASKQEALQTQVNDAKADLEKEWGKQYQDNLKAVTQTLKKTGMASIMEKAEMDGVKLGNHPEMLKIVKNNLSKYFVEGSGVAAGGPGGARKETPGVLSYPSHKQS